MLRCEQVSKSFQGSRALTDVTLTFPRAGIVSIIGPNGAGKTTLINVLTGSIRPDSGRCFIGDSESTGLAVYRIARMGVARTFQDLRLAFQLTCIENVLMARPDQRGERLLPALWRGANAAGESANRTEALRLLRFVGLEDKAAEDAGTLSYGQQKLLTIACCVATDARILLLDEPVAGVHPDMAERIVGLLRELKARGKLVVFIEHDIETVRRAADSVVVLDHGRVIAEGTPHDVLERSEIVNAYVA